MLRARSRAAASGVAVALLLLSCRRGEETSAGRERTPRPTALPSVDAADVPSRERSAGPRRDGVLWVGLDGLDWELLDRLASEGKLPNWSRLTREGYSAKLRSFVPILSPILWTTAATGVGPEIHGVLDFQETDPATGRKVPISGLSRRVPAVWNLASAAGRRVGVVGWWASHPAEEVNGFFVSDHASPILFSGVPLGGIAFPPALEATVARVLERDGAVGASDLAPFLGLSEEEISRALTDGARSGAAREQVIPGLARIVSATRTSQRLARELYDRERPQLLAVYFEGTDEVGHLFARETPPRLSCADEASVARFGRVVDTYYAMIDRILGQWMRRAEEDGATLLVHSDHGFKWGADRPCGAASASWSTAAFWHRLDGVLAAWGSRVPRSEARGEASLFDVGPTILSLLSLPADPKMPGHALAFATAGGAAPRRATSLETVVVRRVASRATSAEQADEYSKKLLALGYLSPRDTGALAPTGGDLPGRTEGAWNNLGVYERDTRHDPAAARAAFEKSLALRSDYYSPMFNLAVLERSRGETEKAEDWLLRALAALGGSPVPTLEGWAGEYEKNGKRRAAESLLERAAQAYPGDEAIARDLGLVRYRVRDCRAAIRALAGFEAATRDPRTFNALALFYTCLEDRQQVIRLLERSLALQPNQPEVARSLERVRGR